MSSCRQRRNTEEEPKAAPKPGTITDIRPQRRDESRVNIFINGSFSFGLHIDIQIDHELQKGVVLDDQQIARLLKEDQTKKAIAAALNLIAYRARAAGELSTKLRERGYAPEAIDGAIARMKDLNYLDDRDFADRWVESRQTYRPRSARMLKQELRQKGVDRDIIESTVEDARIDEFADALTLAEKRAASLEKLEPQVRERRLSGYLARRGYGFDVIRRVLDALGSEED